MQPATSAPRGVDVGRDGLHRAHTPASLKGRLATGRVRLRPDSACGSGPDHYLQCVGLCRRDRDLRRRVIAAGRVMQAPDVVALAEVDVRAADQVVSELPGSGNRCLATLRRSPTVSSAISKSLADDAASGRRSEGHRTHPRLPVDDCVFATVTLPLRIGPILVVHVKPAGTYPLELEREQQAVMTAQAVETIAAREGIDHVAILGDFDAAPDAVLVGDAIATCGRHPTSTMSASSSNRLRNVHQHRRRPLMAATPAGEGGR